MKLLLDSHALLAFAFDPSKLSAPAARAMQSTANAVYVSAISPYELEVKKALGKLGFPLVADWSALIGHAGFQALPVTVSHGVTAAGLPRHHRDPWDRLLVAQAAVDALTLVTADKRIERYGVATLW